MAPVGDLRPLIPYGAAQKDRSRNGSSSAVRASGRRQDTVSAATGTPDVKSMRWLPSPPAILED